MLRSYYAWKNGLPFSYSTAVTPLGYLEDIRYTARGNVVASRRDLSTRPIDARHAIPSHRHHLVGALPLSAELPGDCCRTTIPCDHRAKSIKPGTVIYDPNGHVAVVYKVTPDGRIHYIDTHPDNSLTRGVYGKAFARSSPAMGAGFKRWRPPTLVGATQRPDGTLHGGHIELAPTRTSPTGRTSSSSAPRRSGRRRGQRRQVRARRRDGSTTTTTCAGGCATPVSNTIPLERRARWCASLCEDLKYRVDAVDVPSRRASTSGRSPTNCQTTSTAPTATGRHTRRRRATRG